MESLHNYDKLTMLIYQRARMKNTLKSIIRSHERDVARLKAEIGRIEEDIKKEKERRRH